MHDSSQETSALDELTQSVGGYSGYQDQSARERSDKQLRQHLIANIESLIQSLQNIPNATNSDDQERLNNLVSGTKRKLNTICESLSTPTYIGVPFFENAKVSGSMLEKLYASERSMLIEVANLSEEIAALKNNSLDKDVFEDHFLHIQDFIDNFNQALFEREATILGDEY